MTKKKLVELLEPYSDDIELVTFSHLFAEGECDAVWGHVVIQEGYKDEEGTLYFGEHANAIGKKTLIIGAFG